MRKVFVAIGFLALLAIVHVVFQKKHFSENPDETRPVVVSSHSKPLVAVVPHHDIVKEKRREVLRQRSLESQPETIILVSPNHFGRGFKSILTTDYVWQLRGGEERVESNADLTNRLLKEKGVEKNTEAVRNDHGITNLIGDIHEFFPKARVLPILLREDIDVGATERLADMLLDMCDQKCGIIASVDMSHYQSLKAATIHDIKTIRALEMLDEGTIRDVEVDSNAALSFLVHWAKQYSLSHFTLVFHTNSGELGGNPGSETTTHIMGYYDVGEANGKDEGMTFSIAGNVAKCQAARPKLSRLSDFGSRALWGADIPWVFWGSEQINDSPFRFQLEKEWHWEKSSTRSDTMERDGISVRRSKIGKQQIVFLSGDADSPFLEATLRNENMSERFVVVLPRWKDDLSFQHSQKQHDKAASWVSAGADMVVGFRTGGSQDMEVIDRVPVFYSVGEFLATSDTTRGLLLNGAVEGGKLRVAFDPIQSKNCDTNLLSGDDRAHELQRMCFSGADGCLDGYMEFQRAK